MQQSSSLRFARAVQALAQAARSLGLVVPGFRSPPRLVGVQRSIKRWPGGATVAVVVRDRPWPAVQADLVEGVVAANAPQQPRRRPGPGRAVAGPRGGPATGRGGRRLTRVRSAPCARGGCSCRGGHQRGRRSRYLRRHLRRAPRGRRRCPAPNDWEATVRTAERQHLPPGTYELRGGTPDGVSLSGHAILRFSDGHQHHFRGDGHLGGVEGVVA